jgi:hypothetical protein
MIKGGMDVGRRGSKRSKLEPEMQGELSEGRRNAEAR